ncbi:restriction endonuclease subunit S [Eubacteriales bacterium OttesenSCG-928-A19]|nr:restriction endonuclease subunit S [Eubacteriales bacterium OttesenSCG-928-A19]
MSKWETVSFDEALSIVNGKNQMQVEDPNGQYPIYGSGGIMGYANDFLCPANTVVIGRKGTINRPIFVDEPFWNVDTAFGLKANEKILFPKYLYYFCEKFDFTQLNTTVTIPSLTKTNLLKIAIPLPPLPVQQQIADVLDRASALIEKRKLQIEKLDLLIKSRFVQMFGDPITNPMGWVKKPLGEECGVVTGNTPPRSDSENYGDYIEWIKSDNINTPNMYLTTAAEGLSKKGLALGRSVEAGAVLMTCIAGSISCIGNVAISNRKVSFNQQINAVVSNSHNPYYLYNLFLLSKPYIQSTVNMSLKGILSKGKMLELNFPFPSIDLQAQFATFVHQVEAQKSRLQQSLTLLERNYKSLMQKCFRGEVF